MDYFSDKLNLFLRMVLFPAVTSCMSIGASVIGGSGVKWETLFDGKTLAGWEVHGGQDMNITFKDIEILVPKK